MKAQKLLAVGTDTKTVKGEKQGYLTGILYMIPNDTICPASKVAGCREGCLVTSGLGGIYPKIPLARQKKTDTYLNDQNAFYAQLRKECNNLIKLAKKKGMIPVVRLNGTSDIDHTDFIASMPELQFYDYTKRIAIVKKAKLLPNYHVTFSYSKALRYGKYVSDALKLGSNLAVVFRTKQLPKFFMGLPVINGDETDLRFTDESQVVVGLYAKGRMRKDRGDMVVDVADNIIAMGG
jgi:hypothetical protein